EVAVVARIRRGVEKPGYPQLHVVGEGESARHDPDERRRRAWTQCLAENGRIAAETALPETIADDRRRCQPRVDVTAVEVAADRRRNFQYCEEVGLEHSSDPLRARLRRGRPYRRAERRERGERFEGARVALPVEEVRRRDIAAVD